MGIPMLLKEVAWSIHPKRYKFLSERKFRTSLVYLSKMLLLLLLVSSVFALPKVFSMRATVMDEIEKFSTFSVAGNVSTSAPVTIPQARPVLVVDLEDQRNISDESFLVTRDKIQYRFFGKKTVPIGAIVDPKNNRAAAARFLSSVFVMFAPALLFYFYAYMWLKYVLLVMVAACVFFVLLELTKFRLKWWQLASIGTHALTVPLALEVLAQPFSIAFLLPVGKFLGTPLNLVPIVLFVVLMIAGIICARIEWKPKKPKKRRKK